MTSTTITEASFLEAKSYDNFDIGTRESSFAKVNPSFPIKLIVAHDSEMGIGRHQSIPWFVPGDFRYFRRITSETRLPDRRNAVIMGHNTWLSLPEKYRPLPNRLNIILTRTIGIREIESRAKTMVQKFDNTKRLYCRSNVLCYDTWIDCLVDLQKCWKTLNLETVWIIGGQQIYDYALSINLPDEIHVSVIDGRHDCDRFFCGVDPNIYEVVSQKKVESETNSAEEHEFFTLSVYRRKSLLSSPSIVSVEQNEATTRNVEEILSTNDNDS